MIGCILIQTDINEKTRNGSNDRQAVMVDRKKMEILIK